jgi:uncharacterized protein
MLHRLVPTLLVLGLLLAPLRAAEKKSSKPSIVRNPAPAPTLTAADLDPDLTIYYICLLTKGANAGLGTPEERRQAQAAENAYINHLAKEGKLLVAGPFADNFEWKGLYIFKCASEEEAKAIAVADPQVLAGRLKFEIHPWITEKGSIRDPEFRKAK